MKAVKWSRFLGVALVAMNLLVGANAFAQTTRRGEILQVRAIENKGTDVSKFKSTAESFSQLPGQLFGAKFGSKFGGTGTIIGMAAGEIVADRVAGKIVGVGPSKRYMLKIRFDDKSKIAVVQPSDAVAGLEEGSRVVVTGSGDDIKIAAE